MYFWGQKYQKPPHDVFRGIARSAALHGARKIKPMRHPVADAPQPAPSFSASNESAELLCRHGRHRVKYQFTPTASFHLLFFESVFLFSARRGPTWFRWRKSGRRAESDSGGDGLLANPRSRPTPLSAFRTPASESVGWLLLLFATEKQRKNFPELYAESSVFTNFFLLVLLGPKVPKSSARRFPRDCASRGAAARTLFFRVKRECGITVPPQAAVEYLYGMRSGTLFSRKVIPDLVRWRKSGRRLKARAAGTVCLQTRAVARRRFQPFGRRHRNRSGGFCCFSPSKSREKDFSCTFGSKSTEKRERNSYAEIPLS